MNGEGYNLGISPCPVEDIPALAHSCVTLGYKAIALRGGATLKEDYYSQLEKAFAAASQHQKDVTMPSLPWMPNTNHSTTSSSNNSSPSVGGVRIIHRVDHRLETYGKLLTFLDAPNTRRAQIIALHVSLSNPAFLSLEDAVLDMTNSDEDKKKDVKREVGDDTHKSYRKRASDSLPTITTVSLAHEITSRIRPNQVLAINLDSLLAPPTPEVSRYFKRTTDMVDSGKKAVSIKRHLASLPSADSFAIAKPLTKLSSLAFEISYGLWLQGNYNATAHTLKGVVSGRDEGVSAVYHSRLLSMATVVLRKLQKPILLSSGDCGESAPNINSNTIPSPRMCLRSARDIYSLYSTLMQLNNKNGCTNHPLEEGTGLLRRVLGVSTETTTTSAPAIGVKRERT